MTSDRIVSFVHGAVAACEDLSARRMGECWTVDSIHAFRVQVTHLIRGIAVHEGIQHDAAEVAAYLVLKTFCIETANQELYGLDELELKLRRANGSPSERKPR